VGGKKKEVLPGTSRCDITTTSCWGGGEECERDVFFRTGEEKGGISGHLREPVTYATVFPVVEGRRGG